MREEDCGTDVLPAREASKAKGWIVDGGDDEEVYNGRGLMWRMIGDCRQWMGFII